jgi:hypothetical protein
MMRLFGWKKRERKPRITEEELRSLVDVGHLEGIIDPEEKKMKVEPESIRLEAKAESSKEHPKVYTEIHLTYRFKGKNLPMDKLERAVTLSQERYCGVSAMLKKAAPVTYDIVIEE